MQISDDRQTIRIAIIMTAVMSKVIIGQSLPSSWIRLINQRRQEMTRIAGVIVLIIRRD